ncbi:MAG: peptide ABC transporter substrate-binding protein [Gammaproteobacteria bacterium]
MFRRPAGAAAGAALAATLLLAGIPVAAVAAPAASTLNRGTAAEPNSLDPHIAQGNTAGAVLYDLNVGLTTLDARSRVIPGAAESWTISPDGLTYTFRLRPDLKWSDGSPLASEDFAWSARRLVTPATAARFASFFYPVKNARAIVRGQLPPESLGVEAPDPRTVIYRLEAPAAYFLENLASNVGAPVPRKQVEKFGRQWTRPGQMLTNGPYRLAEVVPQSYIAIEKNPNFYAAGEVQLDRVVYYPTQNADTSLRRYQAGELDLVFNFPGEDVPALMKERPKEVKISPSLSVNYLVMNLANPPFNDARVRRALSLALDREGIVKKFLGTGYRPAWSITPTTVAGYKAPAAKQPAAARLAEARKLLAEAGYGPGKPVQFEIRYESQEENRRIVVAMAAMWRAIGVEAQPLASDLNGLNKDARTGTFQMLRYTWFAPNDDPYSFLGLLETGSTGNYSKFSNPAYDAALKKANATLDNSVRLKLLADAEAMLFKDEPVIPVFYYGRRYLVKPYVKGFEPNQRAVNPSRYLSIRR